MAVYNLNYANIFYESMVDLHRGFQIKSFAASNAYLRGKHLTTINLSKINVNQ